MNKIDLFFAKHPKHFGLFVSLLGIVLGLVVGLNFDFHEAWQYIAIMSYPLGLFVGEKAHKYKEFDKEKLNKDVLNESKESTND